MTSARFPVLPRFWPRHTALAALAVGCLVAGSARASDVAAAEALFLEGRALLEQGDVDAACDKFAESERLEASSGTLLNVAACHERQGKTATAWAEYRGAERLAAQQGKANRVGEARRKVDELKPRLSYLTLRVDRPAAGLVVKRDDTVIEGGGLGTAIPTDPGRHHVTATAPGHQPFAVDIELGVAGDRHTVVIPELRESPGVKAAAATRAAKGEKPAVTAPELPPRRDPTIGLAVAGSGFALAGVGGVFFLLALSADGKAKNECYLGRNYGCTAEGLRQGDRRDTFATLATIGGIAGAVGVGAGAFLLFGPSLSSEKPAPRAALVPRGAPGGGSLSLEGTF